MHITMLLSAPLSCLLASAMVVGGVPLQSRTAQSMAVCAPQFAWMDNSKKSSPCQVAASLNALCNGGNWMLPALNASVKYNPPTCSDGTATICTCSWASYNLLSACTACQGFPEQIPQWSVYSVGCTGFLSNSAFPPNITLPESVSIPYWAGWDPSKWTDETYNVNYAQQIASQGNADLKGGLSTSAPKKSNNVGIIIVGVIAGLLLVIMVIAVVYYMVHRRRKSSKCRELELPPAFPNFKLMRTSVNRPITSPYRTLFAPPAYSESTANLNVLVYPPHLSSNPTDTRFSISTNHSRITNWPIGHDDPDLGDMDHPSLSIAMPQAAALGWHDRKLSTAKHDKRQVRHLRLATTEDSST